MKYSSSRLLGYIMSKFSLIALLLIAPVILADVPQAAPVTRPGQHVVAAWLENGVFRRNLINEADAIDGFFGVYDRGFYTNTQAAPLQPFIYGNIRQGGIFHPLNSYSAGKPIAGSVENGVFNRNDIVDPTPRINGYFDFSDGRFYEGEIPRAVPYAAAAAAAAAGSRLLVPGYLTSSGGGIFYPAGNIDTPRLGAQFLQGTPIARQPAPGGVRIISYPAPSVVQPVINALPVVPFKQ